MSIVLVPRHREVGEFRMGSAEWSYLIGQAGYMFPLVLNGARWFLVTKVDSRFDEWANEEGRTSTYPDILGDSGRTFRVTAEEARWLARVARNWALMQQQLSDEHDLQNIRRLEDQKVPSYSLPFPERVRTDWIEHALEFAAWASRSRGFAKLG